MVTQPVSATGKLEEAEFGAAAVMAKIGGGDCGAPNFMGFKPWYEGLCEGNSDDAEISSPEGKAELKTFIWIIVLNVSFDLSLAVGYLAVGFVIYGGYMYIMSQGDPGKVARGKKTLTSAVIGTVIALVASVAVNTVRVIFGINNIDTWKQFNKDGKGTFGQAQITNIFTWAYSVAGIVAVIFIIRGAFDYMTSQGDPSKVKKATQSIIFAVVGLVIVILAAVITSFITGAVGDSL